MSKDVCEHGYPKYRCSKCPPLPLAAEIMQELVKASEQLQNVRGHSPKCDGTCYCGALADRGEAESRMSWAVVAANNWCESFKQKKIKSENHNF